AGGARVAMEVSGHPAGGLNHASQRGAERHALARPGDDAAFFQVVLRAVTDKYIIGARRDLVRKLAIVRIVQVMHRVLAGIGKKERVRGPIHTDELYFAWDRAALFAQNLGHDARWCGEPDGKRRRRWRPCRASRHVEGDLLRAAR